MSSVAGCELDSQSQGTSASVRAVDPDDLARVLPIGSAARVELPTELGEYSSPIHLEPDGELVQPWLDLEEPDVSHGVVRDSIADGRRPEHL